MKKLQLSIPKPCHENWEAMTPEDKGRFCLACQKTVVDFSAMSDRQIAQFFKKPAASVCGRFHQDQLERPLVIPKKRIPWVRYFFQVTWPALVLFLKSCGQKENLQGKVVVEKSIGQRKAGPTPDKNYGLWGNIQPQIKPVASVAKSKMITCSNDFFVQGEIEVPQVPVMGDTAIVDQPIAVDEPTCGELPKETMPMDTVAITGYQTTRKGYVVMGGISVAPDIEIEQKAGEVKKAVISNRIIAYPNPVQAGNYLTIALPAETDSPQQIQLIATNGALINLRQASSGKTGNLAVPIPNGLAAGSYFLRIITEKQKTETVKIIIQH